LISRHHVFFGKRTQTASDLFSSSGKWQAVESALSGMMAALVEAQKCLFSGRKFK
jgi:hypothetical protein